MVLFRTKGSLIMSWRATVEVNEVTIINYQINGTRTSTSYGSIIVPQSDEQAPKNWIGYLLLNTFIGERRYERAMARRNVRNIYEKFMTRPYIQTATSNENRPNEYPMWTTAIRKKFYVQTYMNYFWEHDDGFLLYWTSYFFNQSFMFIQNDTSIPISSPHVLRKLLNTKSTKEHCTKRICQHFRTSKADWE